MLAMLFAASGAGVAAELGYTNPCSQGYPDLLDGASVEKRAVGSYVLRLEDYLHGHVTSVDELPLHNGNVITRWQDNCAGPKERYLLFGGSRTGVSDVLILRTGSKVVADRRVSGVRSCRLAG